MSTSKSIFELDPERLATTDVDGNRVYLHPQEINGKWQKRRSVFFWFLIGIYLVLPWINIKGKPALQIDIFHREFTFLGETLYGMEPVLMFLAAACLLFMMAFITSVYGRVWCGWACPQTVFIQALFLKIETFIEGTPKQQRELDASSWNAHKIFKRGLKWFLFVLLSLHIAHTFIGYLLGPRELLLKTMGSPLENWGLFLTTMTVTGIFLFDFGWFREQFCIIMCPYGRIQSVMMDENSLVVAYDAKRGEPRFGSSEKGAQGDCVNCYLCVKVCPTGIDIRRGTQLECIHCTRCIDACDNVMDKIKKPRGLIKYNSESKEQHKVFTPRSRIYFSISLILLTAFIYFLHSSTKLKLVFLRAKLPYSMTQEGKIMNQFQLKLSHQGREHLSVDLKIQEPELANKIEIITPKQPVELDKAEKKIVVFFRFHSDLLNAGKFKATVQAIDHKSQLVFSEKEVTLVGPN
ncbi:MAG: cytochrome c oxidase accessory protein CcoG [Bacteriovoracaceae bacterium]|nr:cytochrome c oxidase accessory protein CcoG [Bacteriovoracaceae bacterium]